MKKFKAILIVVLLIICCILCAICVYLNVTKDKTPPEITFDDTIVVYTEGDDTGLLFNGVSASDLIDGDVTDRIIIKSITMEKDGVATVVYVVTDNSYNVTEKSRQIVYKTRTTTTTTSSNKTNTTQAIKSK